MITLTNPNWNSLPDDQKATLMKRSERKYDLEIKRALDSLTSEELDELRTLKAILKRWEKSRPTWDDLTEWYKSKGEWSE